jgi:DNA-binding NarL/FixJ family response regulator
VVSTFRRSSCADALRRAAELAEGLGATPLRDRVAELARRARVTLTGEGDSHRAGFGLTAREVEILRLVTDGLANREIAERLFISVKTASVHVSNILGKLGVANRVEAAATAHRLRLFE